MPSVDALALAMLVVLLIGGTGLCLAALIPATARVARDALPILLTEIVIVGVAVGALWSGGWVLTLALVLMALRVGYEVLATATAPRAKLLIFPGIPFAVFLAAGLSGGYSAWLLLAFIFVETFDSYALLGGKFLGRTKAFPGLSPNKTVEGLISGAIMLAATAAVGAMLLGAPVLDALIYAAMTAPLAVAGDLAASRIKRQAGVKDYPSIMPRQGGLFDITDSWITVGAAFVVVSSLPFAP